MNKKEAGKSVFDIGVEIAEEIGGDDLKESLRMLRDHESLQKARAQAVLQELTSGLPDKPTQDDGIDYLDYVTDRLNKVIAVNLDADSIHSFLALCGVHIVDLRSSLKGMMMANALHNKPGGNRDKQNAIRSAWASGKYSSRDICAEQECAGLSMSFSTARKALRNTPEPPSRRTA